jgi:hypothetical protein
MAIHHRTVTVKVDKVQPQVKPTVLEERVEHLVSLTRRLGGLITSADSGVIQAQAVRLDEGRLLGA